MTLYRTALFLSLTASIMICTMLAVAGHSLVAAGAVIALSVATVAGAIDEIRRTK